MISDFINKLSNKIRECETCTLDGQMQPIIGDTSISITDRYRRDNVTKNWFDEYSVAIRKVNSNECYHDIYILSTEEYAYIKPVLEDFMNRMKEKFFNEFASSL